MLTTCKNVKLGKVDFKRTHNCPTYTAFHN